MSVVVRRAPRRPAWLYPYGTLLRDKRGDVWEVQMYCAEYPYRVWELFETRTSSGSTTGF